MIQLNIVRLWGIPDFSITEGHITEGAAECVWCHKIAGVGEFVMIVQEDGHFATLAMHPKCLPFEIKAARNFVIGLAQVQENRAPQRAWSSAQFADRRSEQGEALGSNQSLCKSIAARPMRSTCEMKPKHTLGQIN